ncbi:MAG: DUF2851 family protein, partial [Nitrospina sp.]|nr:DUF2851 family protein [Nitrospina sp.]
MTTLAPFSDTYLKFANACNQFEVQEDNHRIQVPEKIIRCIWNDQLFSTPALQTPEGQNLEIVDAGNWNFGNGPDFTNATLKVNGKIYTGDVQLDTYATDWNSR